MATTWGGGYLYGSLGRRQAFHQSRVGKTEGAHSRQIGRARCGMLAKAEQTESERGGGEWRQSGESRNCGKENREEGGPRRGEFIAAVFSALPSIFPVSSLPL